MSSFLTPIHFHGSNSCIDELFKNFFIWMSSRPLFFCCCFKYINWYILASWMCLIWLIISIFLTNSWMNAGVPLLSNVHSGEKQLAWCIYIEAGNIPFIALSDDSNHTVKDNYVCIKDWRCEDLIIFWSYISVLLCS